MEMGNQYGINMGNILSTSSNIKTARLNQESKQAELDKKKRENRKSAARERNVLADIKEGQKGYDEEAEDTTLEETENSLIKSKPVNVESDDEPAVSAEPVVNAENAEEPQEPVNSLTPSPKNVFGDEMEIPKLSEQQMKDYAIDSESYDKMVAKVETSKLVQRQYEQKLATLQMTMPDITLAEREILAKASVTDMKSFSDMIVKADDKSRDIAQEKLESNARQLFFISQQPKEGSARKDAYTTWRNSQIAGVPAEKQEQIMKSIPEWNENTMNWIGYKLAEVKDTFDTVNDIKAKKVENSNKVKAETTKHLRQKSNTMTHGDKDIKQTPTKKGWKEESTTSNALLKQDKVNEGKGSTESAKTSDYSLVEKIAIRNTTGLDLDNPDDVIKLSSLSQEQRDNYTKLSARASRIYKDAGGTMTHAEAVAKASKEKSNSKAPKEGKLFKKNGEIYKIENGKPIKQ